eukprot:CAMPEP_0184328272 /NCGR_PEP_ID=MMETSP1049-20130417/143535_1 /TAXON_ID=77928 /ORGANISM="Proteomonas sulcata, Strain CCMP704" /LENGTH=308 /DNA_ID=CAMNT_0026650575 /DNA_START=123 /DNA_END=1049 /DNA_ORIENTATION=-
MQAVKGFNDTYNSFQRLNRGRNVSRAEWEAARDELWERNRAAVKAQEMANQVKVLAERARALEAAAPPRRKQAAKERPKARQWPMNPLDLVKGVNDTYNAFQAANKGRNVQRGEWEQARQKLHQAYELDLDKLQGGDGSGLGLRVSDDGRKQPLVLTPENIEPQDEEERVGLEELVDILLKGMYEPIAYEAQLEVHLEYQDDAMQPGWGRPKPSMKMQDLTAREHDIEVDESPQKKQKNDPEELWARWQTGLNRELLNLATKKVFQSGFDVNQDIESQKNVKLIKDVALKFGVEKMLVVRSVAQCLKR